MKGQKIALKIILIVLGITGLCMYFFLGSVSTEIKNENIIIKSTLVSDTEILFTDIEECLLYDSIDTSMPSMAFQNFKLKSGWFSSSQYGPHKTMVYNNVEKFIIIKANDSYTIFNCKTVEATEKCYTEIQTAITQLPTEQTPETEPTPEITPEVTPMLTPDIGGESIY